MNTIQLSPEVQAIIGRHLSMKSRVLLALNVKAQRTGSPLFTGVGLAEKEKRRRKGRVAKASRKANR